MVPEPPPGVRWQALLVGVASNAHSYDRNFAQSLNSQAEFALALERNMPGLEDNDVVVLPEPRYAYEVTQAIAQLNEAHDEDAEIHPAGTGLLFYYCGHGLNANGQLYFSMVETETMDRDPSLRRTGLGLSAVLETIDATARERPRVALILDCCHAGLACREPAAESAHLLMAVGPQENATHDPDSTGPTYFTGALVELLREGDPGTGAWIDLETACRWLGPRLVSRHGNKRRPFLQTGENGPIVLGRNRAYSRP